MNDGKEKVSSNSIPLDEIKRIFSRKQDIKILIFLRLLKKSC